MSAAVPLIALVATAPEPTVAVEAKVREHVRQHSEEALELLIEVARINSGTLNVDGVRQVGEVFEARLAKLGFQTRWVAPPKNARRSAHLFAERKGKRGKRVLLIGHLDTVFEEDDAFQEVRREGEWLIGPGVYDMKGGNIVILYALEALHAAGALDDVTITVALMGDEEKVGRPVSESRAALVEAAQRSDVALGFEPAVGANKVSIARRGSSSWRLEVRADGGHSSRIGDPKLGAIYEMARLMEEMRKVMGRSETLTLNPGLVLGGSEAERQRAGSKGHAAGKTNRIAEKVVMSGDLRFISEAEKTNAQLALTAAAKKSLAGARSTFTFQDGYPAMPPTDANRSLYRQLDEVSRSLGYGKMELVPPGERGAADISFAAPHVKASLAGMGVDGSGAHARTERIRIDHLPVATSRAAILLLRLLR